MENTVEQLEKDVRFLETAIAEIRPSSNPMGREAADYVRWQKDERRRLEGLLREARLRLLNTRKIASVYRH